MIEARSSGPDVLESRLRSEAYQTLMVRLRPTADGCLPACLRGCREADDLIQDALAKAIRAFQRRGALEPAFFALPEDEILRYMRSAIIRVAVDLVRHLNRAKGPGGTIPALEREPLSDHTSLTGRVRRNEALGNLAIALASLPEDQYQAIDLHFLQGLPHAEVAVAIGKTRASVAGLVRRGLDALRAQLGDLDLI